MDWPATKGSVVLRAIYRVGWTLKRQSGSHRTLARQDWPDYVFAFHDTEESGPRMLTRIAKRTGLAAGRSLSPFGRSARGLGRGRCSFHCEACSARRPFGEWCCAIRVGVPLVVWLIGTDRSTDALCGPRTGNDVPASATIVLRRRSRERNVDVISVREVVDVPHHHKRCGRGYPCRLVQQFCAPCPATSYDATR
ncbi:MAG: type II toxin-antitoxin system HicA family toxin [Acetobacteraceae bacterium]|nr:type II toxin-antitoxin system HicA family toxin [Acetobacteraceae bacterium]